jgi:LuxR family maltose regulon positive regulatory protein
MSTTLLKTKLSIHPLRRELVRRPRLIERLDESLCRKLALVSAPAGYGKTTLIADWVGLVGAHGRAPLPVAWLSLDEGDNDLARFLAYLTAALQRIDDRVGSGQAGQDMPSLLEAPQLPPVESLLAPLINDVTAAGAPLLLVLDDYHTITEPDIHRAIEFLLERQPSHMHTVLLTRQDPPFPLARWRVRGQLVEIRQRDLQFTTEEAAAFLNRSMGLDLSASDVAALEERTEGWIAGLQMAALALQPHEGDGTSRLIEGFSGRHHYVLDYLTDEVLRRQPAAIQAFLLHTCVLERMCGALCEAVVGDRGEQPGEARGSENAQGVLERLERSNLFIVPLDEERTWYRYHRLFAELLRARLREAWPERVPELHRRAAAWYEADGFASDAVYHARKTGEYNLAADVIGRVIQVATTWSRLDGATYLGWLAALPVEVVRARPRLQVLAVRALYVTGQREQAERTLDELERTLGLMLHRGSTEPGLAQMLEQVAADRASYAAARGDVHQATAWARQALADLPESETMARIRPAAVLGLASLRGGDVAGAASAFSQAIAAAEAAGIPFAAAPLMCNLAEVHFVRGRLDRALRTCERAEGVGTVEGRPMPVVGFVGMVRAKVLYERNDLQAAERNAREGLALLRQGRITLGQDTLYGVLARILQAQGDGGGASAAVERALQVARGNDIPRLVVRTAAVQARIWLAQSKFAHGALEQAASWAEGYRQMEQTQYLREFEDLTLARVLLALGEPVEALALLDALLPPAEAAGRTGCVIEALVVRALALHLLGRADRAQVALYRALERAEPEGYVRVFVDEGEAMGRLLSQVAGSMAGYASKLLAALGRPERPNLEAGPLWAEFRGKAENLKPGYLQPETLVEPLTARELQVLALLAEGLTNPEIARQLVVALPTVKSHTRNVYGKLGVHSRREAVARARLLGILPPSGSGA